MIPKNIQNITEEKEAEKILKSLRDSIKKDDNAYYNEDNPLISDAEYDYLVSVRDSLEKKFPNLKTEREKESVGGKAKNTFSKLQHVVPMLSLANAFSEEDIVNFIDRVKAFLNIDYIASFSCELKIDGLSFTAIYEEGILKAAATRGDGYLGENITNNIKNIKNFPHEIDCNNKILEVRGEIYIDKQDFLELNRNQEKLGKPLFANPRNAAAGSIRQLDTEVIKNRPLKYFIYSVGQITAPIEKLQTDMLCHFRKLGFITNPYNSEASSIAKMIEFYEKINLMREKIPYEIDGIVYKVNDLNLQNRLGHVGKNSRFAIALKFPAAIAVSQILNVTHQVGRTGAITPVAELDPVNVAGVIVSRATLHNYQDIEKHDIMLNDYVHLQRAGDVIPKVMNVILEKRIKNTKKIFSPSNCPSCNAELTYDKSEKILRCLNGLNCKAQNYERLCHFVSRNALNIQGLGKKHIKTLIEHDIINSPVDIMLFPDNKTGQETLLNSEGFGEVLIKNISDNIQKAKNITLAKFIYSLGIRYTGDITSQLLAKFVNNVDAFTDLISNIKDEAIVALLYNIDGLGEKTIKAFQDFFSLEENINFVKKLISLMNIKPEESTEAKKLESQIIVFTGSFKEISRLEAKDRAIKLGAKIASQVSKNVTLLVSGEKPGSKLTKAKDLNIKIINEEEWLILIKD